jgi:putative ABC transport system permease protein
VNLLFPLFVKQHFKDTLQRWKETGSWRGEGDVFSFRLQNIKSLHLDPTILGIGSSDIRSSIILGGIAMLILAVACINFINSTIGRASGRSLEIGMRKIIGARKKQLVHQFWTESLLLVFLAMGGGILLASLFLPLFNRLAHKSLDMHGFFSGANLLAASGLLLLVGIAAGSFPSLVMAGFRPVDILKSRLRFGRKTLLTKSLLTVQFMLAVFLVAAAFTMSKQIQTMTRSHLGFRPEGVVVIPLQESGWEEGVKTDALIRRFRDRLMGRAGILNVSASTMTFSRLMVMSHIKIKDRTYDVFFNRVGYDYLETMGIPLTAGRDFSRDFSTDATSVIVNQKFADRYELEDPIGAVIWDAYDEATPLTIIGVVKDYHLQSLAREIEPIILHMRPEATAHNLMVRISTEDLGKTTAVLERTWKELQPDKPYLFSFLDEHIRGAYEEERRWNAIVRWASILALVITGMGVFSLTALTLSRRVKEIGIRRVLGADALQIVRMVGGEFLVLAVVANAAAWPVAAIAMHSWLRGFAFRTSLSPEPFAWAALLTVTVALVTVSALAIRAALADPVRSLRIE